MYHKLIIVDQYKDSISISPTFHFISQSIKGFSNTIYLSPEYISHKKIVTRSFATLSDTGHYDFTRRFFEKGEEAALKSTKYCRLKLRNHTDLFDNLPNLLNKPPIWWLMPWGGVIRKPKLDLQTRLRAKVKYSARFLKLLKSVEKNGLIIDDSFNIPVHKLIDNDNTAYNCKMAPQKLYIFISFDSGGQLLQYKSNLIATKITSKSHLSLLCTNFLYQDYLLHQLAMKVISAYACLQMV